MQRAEHERVGEQLYDGADGPEPPVMKVGSTRLRVHGAGGVPGRTLALPESVLPAAGVETPPALGEVSLATADRAARLLDLGAVDPAGF